MVKKREISITKLIFNLIFILFLVSLISNFLRDLIANHGFASYEISEFLINYQGGFVRRGLLGEILFFFVKNYGIDIGWTIKIISAVCYLFVCFFFIFSFKKRNYSLYILPLCFFCGALVISTSYWIRKDALMICFFILAIWLLYLNKKFLSKPIKIVIINILLIFILLTHEVVAFFTLPIIFLLLYDLFKDEGVFKSLLLSAVSLLPSLLTFLLVILFSGNYETAQTIWDSWHIATGKETTPLGDNNALGALSWGLKYTIIMHLKCNFLIINEGILSTLYWIITFPVIYYITTNFLAVFRKSPGDFTENHKTVLSSIFLFQLICLSPVFIVLSIDYIRLFFYLLTSTFVIFILVPLNVTENLFPKFFIKFTNKINNVLIRLMPPSKHIIGLLMLLIGVSTYAFNFKFVYANTVLYHVLNLLTDWLKPLIDWINNIL